MREPEDPEEKNDPVDHLFGKAFYNELVRRMRAMAAGAGSAEPHEYRQYAEEYLKAQIPSTIPQRENFDTEELWLDARRQWAHKKAVDGAWLEESRK